MDEQPKSQLIAKLKSANYVLVTVSRNPSVDQLAALIGLTLLLNKAGKHAAAVFSGAVPSTLQFLKPEDIIETNTDSLRDFIIALDKSKADKLRYKVEDDVVRIFITPYRTSITDADLNFSQGDFNVDVVVAIGVTEQQDLDEAIISHGRILHDATVVTVNLSAAGDLGSIHWQEPKASSLSEMITDLVQPLSKESGKELIDNQIATALLTGIVAETDRFSNDKTTAAVMSSSAILMAAGANQQLVATQLATEHKQSMPSESDSSLGSDHDNQTDDSDGSQPPAGNNSSEPSEPKPDDGSLAISHNDDDADLDLILNPKTDFDDDQRTVEQIDYVPETPIEAEVVEVDKNTELKSDNHIDQTDNHIGAADNHMGGSKMITEPPTLGGQLTANSHVEVLEPSSDPLGLPTTPPSPLLSRSSPLGNLPQQLDQQPQQQPEPPQVSLPQPVITDTGHQTLSDLENAVHAGTVAIPAEPNAAKVDDSEITLDAARDEVDRALNSITDTTFPPVEALNAQPMTYNLHQDDPTTQPVPPVPTTPSDQDAAMTKMLHQEVPSLPLPPTTAFDPATFGVVGEPGAPLPGSQPFTPAPQVIDPNAAPPVPPPIPFNFGAPTNPPAPQ